MNENTAKAEKIAASLEMLPHPEGGYFKEIYRSKENFPAGTDFPSSRSYATGIYYLLRPGDFSAFHRIQSDEAWHLYDGGPVTIYMLDETKGLSRVRLGHVLTHQLPPVVYIPAGVWFAAVPDENCYALAGCTVSPGFDFNDFELAERESLTQAFPDHQELIQRFTR